MISLFKVLMSPDTPVKVAETLLSGFIAQGPRVDEFEAELSKTLGPAGPVLTVNSCTSALDLALHLIDVGLGDEVITTPVTCTATNSVIVRRGARPVWADVNPRTGIINPEDVARKTTSRTKAIMAVDWSGRVCNYYALRQAAQVPIIEDAAHAFGAQTEDAGDYVCWSFQAIKHLTTGDGGALYAGKHHERAKLLRWYGLDRTKGQSFRCAQNITEPGYKYHMNDIAATIGLCNLPLAIKAVEKHRLNAEFYWEALNEHVPFSVLPPPDPQSSWWLYCILVPRRDEFIQFAAECGIEASPVHARNDKHTGFKYPVGELPGVTYYCDHEVAIPVGWWLTEEDRERVVQTVKAWFSRH